jgi:hypothetical protein
MATDIRLSDEVILNTMQGVIDKFLKPKFIELGMNATGQWLESLEPRVTNGVGQIWGMDYTYWLVHGRKGGTMPPVSALIPWVNAKFGISGSEAKSVAFAVAIKIKNEGTNYYPEGTDLLEILHSQEVADYIYSQYKEGIISEINEVLKKETNGTFS